jgi:hypothetical protein
MAGDTVVGWFIGLIVLIRQSLLANHYSLI